MTAKLEISFIVHNSLWKIRLKPYTKTVKVALEAALTETTLKNKGGVLEVAIVLADDDFVKDLNSKYRGKNKPTNVLSFPDSDFSLSHNLGDIILAIETIETEAKEQKKSLHAHTTHLLIHGFLHLLGYDHIEEKDAEKMEQKEIKILKKLGIKDPYNDPT